MTVSSDKPLSRRQLRETSPTEEPDVAEQVGGAESEAAPDAASFRTRDYRPEGRRSSFAPSFTSATLGEWSPPGPADRQADTVTNTPDHEPDLPATESPADDGRNGWNRPVRSDLDAPERTMTRRELRVLRARAEAAGQPAPDVVFLPNGETTVTGAIDILDSPEPSPAETAQADEAVTGQADEAETGQADEAATGQSEHDEQIADVAQVDEVAPEADAAGVITETADDEAVAPHAETVDEVIEDAVVVDDDDVPIPPDVESADREHVPTDAADADTAPQADAAGVVTEQPVDDDPASDAESVPVIPALIEPAAGESPRFHTDAGTAPAEIVVDAEQSASDSDGTPAPGTLRPFDALFLPPSARDGSESRSARDGLDPALDTSSAQPTNDTDGLRGDILAAPDGPPKPFGHWSTQNDDDGPHTDGTLSRDVGMTTGALTTHALVLPSIPDSGEPLLSPLTSTGEVMVTGTIDLPRSFGSTGAHPALFDHPDVDAIIDDTDRDESDAGIAPVRASRAVSSSTTTRSMIGTEAEKKSRLLPIVGIVVGGIIVVAAATIVIVMFATNQF